LCPDGYDFHVDTNVGFSVCYPAGWVISEFEEPEESRTIFVFDSPSMDAQTGAGFKMIVVQISPNTASSEEEALTIAAEQLTENFGEVLLDPPHDVTLDGRRAVEATFEILLAFGEEEAEEIIESFWWETVSVTDDKQWVIRLAGRSEYRQELEAIHGELLSHFHVLPPQ
jgi:hypothetical protein